MKGGGLEKLEANFSKLGETLWEKLSDLNVSGDSLQPLWTKLVQARKEIATFHGVAWVAKNGGGGAAAKGGGFANAQGGKNIAGGDAGESSVEDWKTKLSSVYSRETKEPCTKELIQYQSDTAASGNGFQAVVLCSWSGSTYLGEEKPSKKQAEHAAAKKALQAEFPQAFAEAKRDFRGATGGKGNVAKGKGKGKVVPAVGGNKKRKHDATESSTSGDDSKSMFLNKMTVVKAEMGLGSLATGDIHFKITPSARDADGDKFTAALSVGFLPGNKNYSGKAQESKKAAEKSACEVAMKALNGLIAKHEGSYQEKKKQKNTESLEKLKAAVKAKKAAGGE